MLVILNDVTKSILISFIHLNDSSELVTKWPPMFITLKIEIDLRWSYYCSNCIECHTVISLKTSLRCLYVGNCHEVNGQNDLSQNNRKCRISVKLLKNVFKRSHTHNLFKNVTLLIQHTINQLRQIMNINWLFSIPCLQYHVFKAKYWICITITECLRWFITIDSTGIVWISIKLD